MCSVVDVFSASHPFDCDDFAPLPLVRFGPIGHLAAFNFISVTWEEPVDILEALHLAASNLAIFLDVVLDKSGTFLHNMVVKDNL